MLARFGVIEKRLATSDSRFDAMDRRFDQLTMILTRMENNQITDKAQGKAVASPSDSPGPAMFSSSRSAPELHPSGFGVPPSVFENREGLLKKLEMPVFSGENPFGWIAQVERYFRIGQFHGLERLQMVSLSLAGHVLNWFNGEMEHDPFTDWHQFKRRLVSRFRQRIEDEPGKRLFSIRQTGTIAEYVNEFGKLRSIVTGVDEQNLVHVFFNGLKPEMQEVIKMKEPKGRLTEHIAAVIGMEGSAFCTSISLAVQSKGGTSRGSTTQSAQGFSSASQSGFKGGHSSGHVTGGSFRPRLKYTSSELDAIRRDNICFKCRGPYSKTHVCPKKELHILTVINGYEVEILDEGTMSNEQAWGLGDDTERMELSLNAFLGIDTPTTTKLMGVLGNTSVVVLIDSGATHNFLAPRVVQAAKLPFSNDRCFQVLLGTWVTVESMGVCQAVTFSLQDIFFTSDFVSLELSKVDVVLGIQWLRTFKSGHLNIRASSLPCVETLLCTA